MKVAPPSAALQLSTSPEAAPIPPSSPEAAAIPPSTSSEAAAIPPSSPEAAPIPPSSSSEAAAIPPSTIPLATVPSASVPSASVPLASVPLASVPSASFPSASVHPAGSPSSVSVLLQPRAQTLINTKNNICVFYENLSYENSPIKDRFLNDLMAFENDSTSEYDALMRDYHNLLKETKIDDPYIKSSIVELIEGVKSKILSSIKVKVLLSKIKGASYQSITHKFRLLSKVVAQKNLLRTACGRKWDRNMKGGGEKILSDLDEEVLKKNIEERADDIDCISTHVANILAYHLQESRCKKARSILAICKCRNLMQKIKSRRPDARWLKKAAERMGIKVIPKQELEKERRMACDKAVINQFNGVNITQMGFF